MNAHLKTALRWGLGSFALTCTALAGMQINAQAIAGHNSRAPIDVGADRIEAQDRQDRIVLSGNVDITQAGLRLKAARTIVDLRGGGATEIQRLTATGGVQVTRADESASGEVAIYDLNRRIITMAGNVRLRRGNDTLNGGRLVIDLASGVSSIDGRASGSSSVTGSGNDAPSGGRVTGRFTVPQD